MAIIPTQAVMRLNESWFKPTKYRIFFSKLMSYKLMRVNATIHGNVSNEHTRKRQ